MMRRRSVSHLLRMTFHIRRTSVIAFKFGLMCCAELWGSAQAKLCAVTNQGSGIPARLIQAAGLATLACLPAPAEFATYSRRFTPLLTVVVVNIQSGDTVGFPAW